MTSTTRVERSKEGWVVVMNAGLFVINYGPYRWRWVARLVAWMEDGWH